MDCSSETRNIKINKLRGALLDQPSLRVRRTWAERVNGGHHRTNLRFHLDRNRAIRAIAQGRQETSPDLVESVPGSHGRIEFDGGMRTYEVEEPSAPRAVQRHENDDPIDRRHCRTPGEGERPRTALTGDRFQRLLAEIGDSPFERSKPAQDLALLPASRSRTLPRPCSSPSCSRVIETIACASAGSAAIACAAEVRPSEVAMRAMPRPKPAALAANQPNAPVAAPRTANAMLTTRTTPVRVLSHLTTSRSLITIAACPRANDKASCPRRLPNPYSPFARQFATTT